METAIPRAPCIECARAHPEPQAASRRLLRALVGALALPFEILLEWQARERQRQQLRELSDHLLKDLGLSRADIEKEASKPFWRA